MTSPTRRGFDGAYDEKTALAFAGVPPHLSTEEFRDICHAATLAWTDTPGMNLTAERLKPWLRLHNRSPLMIAQTMNTPQFGEFLVRRGLLKSRPDGYLDERQLLTLTLLTDLSDRSQLKTRLNRIGVKWWEFQAWMKLPEFATRVSDWADDALQNAIPLAKIKVAEQATEGKLEGIKYLLELTGVHDPARRQQQDVHAVLRAVVEVLTRNLAQHPELLAKVSTELSILMSGSTAGGSTRATPQAQIVEGPD